MLDTVLRNLPTRWPAFVLLLIGIWKTSEFAEVMGGNTGFRVMAGLLFFVLFLAAEMNRKSPLPGIVHVTRMLLLMMILFSIVGQALHSSEAIVSEQMERKRLGVERAKISRFEETKLAEIIDEYDAMLKEANCKGATKKAPNAVACEPLWKGREEAMNFRAWVYTASDTSAGLRADLLNRVQRLRELWQKVPSCRRKIEVCPEFDLSEHRYDASEIMAIAWREKGEPVASAFWVVLGKGLALLVLTLVVGWWHWHTSCEAKQPELLLPGTWNGDAIDFGTQGSAPESDYRPWWRS